MIYTYVFKSIGAQYPNYHISLKDCHHHSMALHLKIIIHYQGKIWYIWRAAHKKITPSFTVPVQ